MHQKEKKMQFIMFICVPQCNYNDNRIKTLCTDRQHQIHKFIAFNKPSQINCYTPINKKLLAFPYNYLLMSNNNGTSNILYSERFTSSNCKFLIKGIPVVGASIKCLPYDYDSINLNEEEGIVVGKFPTLNWATDEYTN